MKSPPEASNPLSIPPLPCYPLALSQGHFLFLPRDATADAPVRVREQGACVRGDGLEVEIEHFFSGSALNAVDAKGRLSVPAGIRSVIERRSEAKAIVLGLHEVDSCLVAYDRNYGRFLHRENERIRLVEEERDPRARYSRDRRTFGIVEEVPYDPSGRIILPRMIRSKGRIEDLALFVGTGATVEIWNPKLAIGSGDEGLRDLAQYHLEEKGIIL